MAQTVKSGQRSSCRPPRKISQEIKGVYKGTLTSGRTKISPSADTNLLCLTDMERPWQGTAISIYNAFLPRCKCHFLPFALLTRVAPEEGTADGHSLRLGSCKGVGMNYNCSFAHGSRQIPTETNLSQCLQMKFLLRGWKSLQKNLSSLFYVFYHYVFFLEQGCTEKSK